MERPAPEQVLQHVFRLDGFRPGQRPIIDALLAGRSALAVFPTGGGKSLCYQLPALLLDGLTVVVSPLIALMKDQVDRLNTLGVAAARLDSSLALAETQTIYRALRDGSLKLLYVSPERLNNERFLQRLQQLRISLLAIDEAHCISEWGHNFRPDYLKLAGLARSLRVERVLALTATATPAVCADICQRFAIADNDVVKTGVRRPNLRLHVTPSAPEARPALLLARLKHAPAGASIVYVTLQKTAEEIAGYLRDNGVHAACYHAGMDDDERHRVQNDFMAGTLHCIVATIAFGMGIDKADIRALYHYNLPKSIENYMQEIGRAGRDGKPSHCELFAATDDLRVLANFSYGDTPCALSLAEMLDDILGQPEQFAISSYEWSQRYDIRPLVLGTALTYLELAGVIRATGPFYSGYKVQFQQTLDDICAHMNGERAAFLRRLFGSGKPGRRWLTLDLDAACAATGQNKDRIQKALNYLEEKALIVVQASGLKQGYQRGRAPVDAAALHQQLQQQFAKREQSDIQRLKQVLDYAGNSDCLHTYLQRYFGETAAEPCRECSSCQQREPRQIPRTTAARLSADALQLLAALHAEQRPGLRRPRQLARFLCGLPSPATSRGKLSADPHFGALAGFAFPRVLQAIQGQATVVPATVVQAT